MSEQTTPQTNPVSTSSTGSTQHPANAASTAPSGSTSFGDSNISSLGELKQKAPEVYDAMLKGIAEGICNKMNDHQERLKKIMREATRDAYG